MAVHAVDSPPPPRSPRAGRLRPSDHASIHVVRRAGLNVLPWIALGVLASASLALFGFGANLLYLTWRAARVRPRHSRVISVGAEPRLCVQVPIYNERYVAERVLDAVCELDWPRTLFEIQVLDDSDDETTSIIARRAAYWGRRGIKVAHVRRGSRDGFKAGALAYG